MTPEEELMLEQARTQIETANLQTQQLQNQNMTQAGYMEQQDKGMAEEQLDLSEEIERIENLLRGRIIKKDEQGIEYWSEPETEEQKLLNEYGIRLIMKTITFYLAKRKLLSNYTAEQIDMKMLYFTEDLIDLIFMKYREIGLDTPDKRKCYPILVREIQDAVHDVYLRAMGGKERDSIRKRWNLNEQIGTPMNMGGNNKGGMSLFNPRNYLR